MSSRPVEQGRSARWRAGALTDPLHLVPPHPGVDYLDMLAAAHRVLAPLSYFEIGSFRGASLSLSRAPTIAVDPGFKLAADFAACHPHVTCFEMTSDRFFASNDLRSMFGGPVDFAFLDGMHRFEFLLRDFMNTEAAAASDSVIVLHDCVPFSSAIVARTRNEVRDPNYDVAPGAWAGDVWKVLPILKEHRPDLHFTVFDCPPTGLAFISQLDPGSRVLHERYEAMVAEYLGRDLLAEGGVAAFASRAEMVSSRGVLGQGDDALRRLVAPGR